MAASATPRPTNRYIYGVNLPILSHLILELSHSQIWLFMPPDHVVECQQWQG